MRSALGCGMAALMFASLTASCAKYTTYSYQHKLDQDFIDSEDPEPPPVEARQLLASAKTVAFYPPDSCVNSDPLMERKKLKELRASCGVLMSSLERAAQGVGYEVLSWQNLRGAKRPIDYAREGSVDVLFEINEFESGELADSISRRSTTYFLHTDDGQQQINPPPNVTGRCGAYSRSKFGTRSDADTATIDIKTVSVSDGRDRWHYRKTESHSYANYPQVTFKGQRKPNKLGSILGPFGIVALGAGIGLLVVENLSEDNPLTPENDPFRSGVAVPLVIGGAIALAAGIVLEAKVGGPTLKPGDVLCREETLSEIIANEPNRVQQDPNVRIGDPVQRSQKRMLDGMVKQFTEELKAAKASRPAAPVAPPVAPQVGPAEPPGAGSAAPPPAPPSVPPAGTPPTQP